MNPEPCGCKGLAIQFSFGARRRIQLMPCSAASTGQRAMQLARMRTRNSPL